MGLATASVAALAVYAVVLVTGAGSDDSDPAPIAKKPSVHSSEGGRKRSKSRTPQKTWTPRPLAQTPLSAPPAEENTPELSYEQRAAQANERAVKKESAFIERFRAEPTDTTFANTWESRLDGHVEQRLTKLSGFKDIDVECRSESCLAEATWDSFEAASAALEQASDLTRGECATAIFMPDPDVQGGAYAHKIRFSHCNPPES